jgi:hypothetical protein
LHSKIRGFKMNIFGGMLPVISVPELIEEASQSTARIQLELCPCKELGKLVVRVVDLSVPHKEDRHSRLLVDKDSEEYFISGRTASGMRRKLERYLTPIKGKMDIVQREDGVVGLFQGGAVTAIGNSVMGR